MKHGATLVVLAGLTCILACSSSSKGKGGGGANTAGAAQSASQQSGQTVLSDTSAASNQGATYQDVTCDSSAEGIGFCSDDENVVFCAGGAWYELDCSSLGGAYYCDDQGSVVDCYDD